MFDWCANRLVDSLAKMFALEAQNIPQALKLIRSSEAAVRYPAKLLGRTTFAANHHVTTVVDDDGKKCNKVSRDSVSATLAQTPSVAKASQGSPGADRSLRAF